MQNCPGRLLDFTELLLIGHASYRPLIVFYSNRRTRDVSVSTGRIPMSWANKAQLHPDSPCSEAPLPSYR